MIVSETPVIIGVGDIKNRTSNHKEPAVLIHEAVLAAIKDTSASDPTALQSSIDSISVVRTWTWPYPDLPGLLASKLGAEPKYKFYSEHGGEKPGRLLDEAAKRIARGETKLAVVAGGEALASLTACAAAGKLPPPGWTKPAESVESVFTPTGMDLGKNLGALHDLGAPIQVYPLYENAFRAHRGQSVKANHEESARLYAEFSKVASQNEISWSYGQYDDEKKIGTVGKKNRMICSPYPLLMNAFNTVNLAAACILTSTAYARDLGIPESKWVYPLSGAGASDAAFFWNRPNFYTSPCMSQSLDAALSLAQKSVSEIDLFDFYSCFPIVPKLAAQHLGLPITGGEKSLTLLGGLTSFGGAGNNYSMHALTAMTRAIRQGKGMTGLVLCNGGVMSYQHVVVLSKAPRTRGAYPQETSLPQRENAVPDIEERPEGEAEVETYTVEFNRDGTPLRGYIVGRLKSNSKRFLANHGDEMTLRQMAEGAGEVVGRAGWVVQDGEKEGRSLFSFDRTSRI
ncbi:acetyl-CoA acetyltransferase-like protein [Paraphaeosphaeria sporulosa]|uniref:Acetyl-CoA acetyltransferas-like protein n=1 Tax=Paraphaeosphaeria sporulosa TaxID=1460663 RepID=A0A177BX55_9PLEO|nr:acetyl-CoA acetyltransferase-like protein [Paraphaeosphaeria sporulosa]OAF98899.1 acetyl-CoA acetyltransferas-like protein [Paraphaeosphaeria sporulosa]